MLELKENPSNGNRNAAEKARFPPCKMPLIIDRSQPKLHRL